jgi:hypothetical protein
MDAVHFAINEERPTEGIVSLYCSLIEQPQRADYASSSRARLGSSWEKWMPFRTPKQVLVGPERREMKYMIYTIALVLLVLWLLGLVSSYTMGGFIHLLLLAALVIVTVQLIRGRRVL